MFVHTIKNVFRASDPSQSFPFTITGTAKAFGGSIYMPGANTARLDFSIDGGATWIGPGVSLTVTTAGFFSWPGGAYLTFPLARVQAVSYGTVTNCLVFVPE